MVDLAKDGDIELTVRVGCPVMCQYCPQDKLINASKSDIKVMMPDDLAHYLSTVPSQVPVSFSGYAEPFSNPYIMDLIEMVHHKGHPSSLLTTCFGMKADYVDQLLKYDWFLVDIHICDDQGFMPHHKVDDSYLEAFDKVMSSKWRTPRFKTSVLKGVDPRLEKIMLDRGVKLVGKGIHARAGNVPDLHHPVHSNKADLICVTNRLRRNVLMPNGDVQICCMDYGKEHCIGNLRDMTYAELHESEEFKDFVARMSGKSPEYCLCRTCHWAKPKQNIKLL